MAEITNETDSDTVLVCPVSGRSAAMSAGDLVFPAEGDLYLAVGAVSSVSDDEVVSDTFPVISFSMPFVEDGSVSLIGSGVVNDDGGPVFFEVPGWIPLS